MKTVIFKFDLYQSVKIAAVGVNGFVCGLTHNDNGHNEYRVTYWIESRRNTDWFHEHELVAA